MVALPPWLFWALVAVSAWVAYESFRFVVVRAVKRRYEAAVDRFIRANRIPTDSFRHTHRVVVREMVLSQPGLVAAMAERARADGTDVTAVQEKVRNWLDEIVPQFNLLAYYQVGYRIGRIMAYSTYNVHLDEASLQRAQAAIPEGASVVYVSNHRSNADFVVTGFMLSRSVQVSYAVGEWARVWPLESIFRSFGSYFVRRGEKDPLYHSTLETYLQLITKQGVTQAMFPEGGLSRDGRLRPVKLGLLDYMARAKLDPEFEAPLVFVPVGINFDRVLEDENLVAEAKAGELGAIGRPRRTLRQKAWRLTTLLGKIIVFGPWNVYRFATKRLKKHGVAAITFGEPITFDEWRATAPTDPLALVDRRERQSALRPFGDELMHAIAEIIPATPVTLLCAALSEIDTRKGQRHDRGAVLAALRRVVDEQSKRGRPFAIDPYAESGAEAGRWARNERRQELADLAAEVAGTDDLEQLLDMALDVAGDRILEVADDGGVIVLRGDLVEYYAASLTGAVGAQ